MPPTQASPATRTEELTAEFLGVRWSSNDSTFLIGSVRGGHIVMGNASPTDLVPGASYRFLGNWKTHPKHGLQFHFRTFVESTPHTYHGVVNYILRNTRDCGIGDRTAYALVDAFGPDRVVAVLKREPELAAQKTRLSAENARRAGRQLVACERFEQTKIDLLDLFAGRGFPHEIVDRCVKRFGVLGPRRIRRDPFVLLTAQMPGCGFARCDRLYRDLGLPLDRLKRQAICLWHLMRSDMTGSVWFRLGDLTRRLGELVSGQVKIQKAMRLGIKSRMLASRHERGEEWLATHQDARDEHLVSMYLHRITEAGGTWPSVDGIPASDALTEHQREALHNATRGPVGLLTGLPGSGKTFCLSRLFSILPSGRVALAAPTGRAAVRMMELLEGHGINAFASTIHSLLGVQRNGHDGDGWNFLHNESMPLAADYIIIDESSMVTNNILAHLLSAVRPGACILFIGDHNQLPPVGAGRPFLDMMQCGFAHGELTYVHRFAGRVGQVCKAINFGLHWTPSPVVSLDVDEPENLRHVERSTPLAQLDVMKTIVQKLVDRGQSPIWDIQVLCACRENTPLSRSKLNAILHPMLNPDGMSAPKVPFRVGDKVMCLWNGSREEHGSFSGEETPTHYIANGEIGIVTDICSGLVAVRFYRKKCDVRFTPDDWCNLDLAYACTVHKAQGSEFRTVIVMIDSSGSARHVCSRAHHYTAISRTAELCITIGRKSVLDLHCRRVDVENRVTFLREDVQRWNRHPEE